jgi:hypothetical protein
MDWGLAMRSIIALVSYRISRYWDAALIALVPVKQTLLAAARSSHHRTGPRGAGVPLIASLVTLLSGLLTKREAPSSR